MVNQEKKAIINLVTFRFTRALKKQIKTPPFAFSCVQLCQALGMTDYAWEQPS